MWNHDTLFAAGCLDACCCPTPTLLAQKHAHTGALSQALYQGVQNNEGNSIYNATCIFRHRMEEVGTQLSILYVVELGVQLVREAG